MIQIYKFSMIQNEPSFFSHVKIIGNYLFPYDISLWHFFNFQFLNLSFTLYLLFIYLFFIYSFIYVLFVYSLFIFIHFLFTLNLWFTLNLSIIFYVLGLF